MKTILVVEDELSIRSFVCLNLRKKGYEVFEAETGEDALVLFQDQTIHVVILDIMLPGIDGFAVCDEMRNINPTAGIIMLTARSQDEDKVKGLLLGADDYLTKPFLMSELEARILSLLRRLSHGLEKETSGVMVSGSFSLDSLRNKLTHSGTEIRITPTEACLLQFLISNKNKGFTRDEILDQVWGTNYLGDPKVVDVNIRRIRRKIEPDPKNPRYLCTEWGYGYLWKE